MYLLWGPTLWCPFPLHRQKMSVYAWREHPGYLWFRPEVWIGTARCNLVSARQFPDDVPEEKPTMQAKVTIQQKEKTSHDQWFDQFSLEGGKWNDRAPWILFDRIATAAKFLKINLDMKDLAVFVKENEVKLESFRCIEDLFLHLQDTKKRSIIHTLLTISRLPMKEPKTFDAFDFGRFHGK